MASIDSISESAPIDIEVSGAQGPRGRDAAATVVTANFTAANDYQYNVTASSVATDPTGVEGKGYTVFVINGTATVGGVAYPTEGTVIRRYFKSGTWYSKVYKDATAYATAAQGTDERVPTTAGLISKFGTAKGSLADGDKVAIFDSAAADAPKHTLWSVVKSTLKTYFDTVYAAIVHTHVSAQITDASTEPVYNESTELYEEVAVLYDENGEVNAAGFNTEGGSFYSFNGDDFASFSLSGSPLSFKIGTKQFRFNQPVGNGGQYTVPDGSGTLALTSSASGAIVSADISDATTTGQANKVTKLDGSGGLTCVAITASGAISTTGAASHISTSNANAAVMSSNFLPVESGGASLKDGSYNACLTWGQSGRNLTIPSGVAVTIDATNFTLGTGAASALKTALAIASADITDATSSPTANKVIKYGANAQATAAWYQFPTVVSASTFNVTPLIFCPDYSATTPSAEWEPIYGLPLIPEADVSTTLAITQNTDGSADKLTGGTISGATTFNSSSFTYGSGVAAAHRTALALNNVDNTSDASKPVSTAQQTALNLKANLSGGNTFTGAQTISGTGIVLNCGTDPAVVAVGTPATTGAFVGGYYTAGGNSSTIYFGQNSYFNGSAFIQPNTAALSSNLLIQSNNFLFYTQSASNPSNALGSLIARINNTGLAVGSLSPTCKLDINGDTMRLRTARTPVSATAAGNVGDYCWDANYEYRCVAINTWKRTALSTW